MNAVIATGSVAPSPTTTEPSAKTARAVTALVPEPNRIPPSVKVVTPIPPFATGNVPVIPVVKIIFGPRPAPPVWSCPVVALKADSSWLYSLLK